MAWSGKISFIDDILAPKEEVIIKYSGKNPFLICTIGMRLIRDVLKVSTSQMREDDVRWDVTGKTKTFYVVWRGYRGEDNWTKTKVKMIVEGSQDPERNGSVTIWLKGFLETSFEYHNPFDRILWQMWSYIFYWKQRRAYIDFSRDDIMRIREEILAAYRILHEERIG